MEKPKAFNKINVPIIDTGTATSGIIAARQVCKNSSTTIMTSSNASKKVITTASMDCCTNCVVS